MLSAMCEREKFENENIIDVSSNVRETLRVRFVPEPFDSIKIGSGHLAVSLLVGQNPKHVLYNHEFKKTLKRDYTIKVRENLEREIAMSFFTDETFNEAKAQAITIICSFKGERDLYVKEFLRILQEKLVKKTNSCLVGAKEHIWQVDERFPSGNFKVRHCLVCSTKETLGR